MFLSDSEFATCSVGSAASQQDAREIIWASMLAIWASRLFPCLLAGCLGQLIQSQTLIGLCEKTQHNKNNLRKKTTERKKKASKLKSNVSG